MRAAPIRARLFNLLVHIHAANRFFSSNRRLRSAGALLIKAVYNVVRALRATPGLDWIIEATLAMRVRVPLLVHLPYSYPFRARRKWRLWKSSARVVYTLLVCDIDRSDGYYRAYTERRKETFLPGKSWKSSVQVGLGRVQVYGILMLFLGTLDWSNGILLLWATWHV